jgi:hypothetical protein
MPVHAARVVHISVDRNWREVYAFASSKPGNMPRWASGLASGLKHDGEDWIGDGGPIGEIRVRFAPDNRFGVIDHTVTLADGTVVENALRVTPNHDGAEVSFVVIRQAAQDDAAFDVDAAHVAQDLAALKRLLET